MSLAAHHRNDIQTPPRVVIKMCNLACRQVSDIYKKILEPSCGTGNFLIEVLRRRLSSINYNPEKALIALSTIYGIDIIEKNIVTSRMRLCSILEEKFPRSQSYDYRFWPSVDLFLQKNIICADFLGDLSKIKIIEWDYQGELNFHGKPYTMGQILTLSHREVA